MLCVRTQGCHTSLSCPAVRRRPGALRLLAVHVLIDAAERSRRSDRYQGELEYWMSLMDDNNNKGNTIHRI